MNNKLLKTIIMGMAIAILLASCSTAVYRTRIGKKTDLSGRWNDTDSRLVAQTMIRSLLSGNWIRRLRWSEGNKPVVIVGEIENLTSEHVETGTFIKDIERELIESGRVKFVASAEEREGVRAEREDQQSQATRKTRAQLRQETGADVMLIGSIKSQIDSEGNRQVRFYQVDLELIHLESNEKVWLDTHKIKKYVEKPLLRL